MVFFFPHLMKKKLHSPNKKEKSYKGKNLFFICLSGCGGGLYQCGILIDQRHNISQIWKYTMHLSLSFSGGSDDRSEGPAGQTYRVPVPAAHVSRCDGSWDNYLPSGCVCNCKMEQGFPSGSPPAQVSEQLMTFLSNGMKEVTVVCSQLHTTFLLLSAVCLNLPAAFFTPQGDHVIRSPPLLVCHPAAPLLQRGTAGAEKGKQCKQSGGPSIKCSSFTGSESVVSTIFFQELLGSCSSFLCKTWRGLKKNFLFLLFLWYFKDYYSEFLRGK